MVLMTSALLSWLQDVSDTIRRSANIKDNAFFIVNPLWILFLFKHDNTEGVFFATLVCPDFSYFCMTGRERCGSLETWRAVFLPTVPVISQAVQMNTVSPFRCTPVIESDPDRERNTVQMILERDRVHQKEAEER